jgi:hypothetical protein
VPISLITLFPKGGLLKPQEAKCRESFSRRLRNREQRMQWSGFSTGAELIEYI